MFAQFNGLLGGKRFVPMVRAVALRSALICGVQLALLLAPGVSDGGLSIRAAYAKSTRKTLSRTSTKPSRR